MLLLTCRLNTCCVKVSSYYGTYCNIGIQLTYPCLFYFDEQVTIGLLLFFGSHLEVG